jgi:YD repeat-containing protein
MLAERCALEQVSFGDDRRQARRLETITDLKSRVTWAQRAALIHGISYLVTAGHREFPRIHVVDALNGFGEWDWGHGNLKRFIEVTERTDGRISSFVYHAEGRRVSAHFADAQWQTVFSHTQTLGVEALVYKPHPGRWAGHSLISETNMRLTDAAVRTLVRLEGHLDIYAYPKDWLFGPDKSIFADSEGNQTDAIDAGLGNLSAIPDNSDTDVSLARASVQRLTATDPTPQLAGLNAYAKLFARENSLPDSALAITDFSNPTSAESYDASQYELVIKARSTTRDWTMPVARTIANAMAIDGSSIDIEDISLHWTNPQYLSVSQIADAGGKQLSAIPWLPETDIALELLGLTPEQIDRVIAQRDAARMDLLTSQVMNLPPLPASAFELTDGDAAA